MLHIDLHSYIVSMSSIAKSPANHLNKVMKNRKCPLYVGVGLLKIWSFGGVGGHFDDFHDKYCHLRVM